MENETLNPRRIGLFILIAFCIAWATAYVIYRDGGLQNGSQLAPGLPLALVLLAGPYMFAPAIANVATRLLTREGFANLMLWPRFAANWRYWLIGWFLPGLLTLAGAALYFVLVPGMFDPALGVLRQQLQANPGLSMGNLPVEAQALLGVILGFLLAPLNLLNTWGEEFGWRAYLLPRLLPLGRRAALALMGLIWGVWHWPVIFMGYEYGTNYPGWPWVGPLLFVWVAFGLGTLLGWLALRSKSVWPAAMGHAAMNAIAAVALMFLVPGAEPNPLVGPLPVGVLGGAAYSLVAVWLLFKGDWGGQA